MALKISGVTLGNITGGPSAISLNDLSNVSISSPQTSQYLRYNGLTSEWSNSYINTDMFDRLNTTMSGTDGVSTTFTSGAETIVIGLGNITPDSVAATGTVTGSNLSGTNTGDQTITLTGDVTGSGTGSFATTLSTVNSNVGQYAVTTVNAKGLVTAATDLLVTGDATGMSSGASVALTLATVNSSPQSDQFRRITVNGKGLVTASSAVSSSDITTALGYTPVNLNGDTMTGYLILNADPVSTMGAVTKQYADGIASGVNIHAAAVTATTTTLASASGGTVTYNNGTSGVGATLTTTGSYGTIGGYSTQIGDRILVKDEASAANNGVYVKTSTTVLTRATDFDGSPSSEVEAGDMLYVQQGSNSGTQWVVVTTGTITIGTTGIVFSQFAGSGTYTAGSGIDLSTNVISNTGVLSNVAGSGISVSGATGNVTITNSGVTSLVAGTNIDVSGATGAVTVSVTGTVPTATTATNSTNSAITDDTTTATSVYPTWVTATTGNLPIKTTSTKLTFVPSTGTLSLTGILGVGVSSPTMPADIKSKYTFAASTNGALRIENYTSTATATYIENIAGTSIYDDSQYYGSAQRTAKDTASSGITLNSGVISFTTDSSLTVGAQFTPTARMNIDTSGNVGIGTTAAANRRLDILYNANTAARVQFTNTDAGTGADARIVASNGASEVGIIMRGTGYTTNAGHGLLYVTNDNPIVFSTNGAERARIDSVGLGVGGTAVARPVEVYNNTRSIIRLSANATTGTDALGGLEFYSYDGTSVGVGATLLHTYNLQSTDANAVTLNVIRNAPFIVKTNNAERLRVDGSGNVAIGGSTSGKLHVSGGSIRQTNQTDGNDGFLQFNAAGTRVGSTYGSGTTYYRVQADSGVGRLSLNTVSGYISFEVNATEKMRMTNAGELLVGGTSLIGTEKFQVNEGDARLHSTSSSTLYFSRNFIPGAGNGLGGITFQARVDATTYQPGAQLIALGDGTWSATSSPSYLSFRTSSAGSIVPNEKMKLDSNGYLLLGYTTGTGRVITATAPMRLQVESIDNTAGLSVTRNTADVNGPNIRLLKTRGTTFGSVTAVTSGDSLGQIQWFGTDGTNILPAAEIRAEVDAGPGTNDMPGRIVFYTTADGASTVTERMRINNAGLVTMTAGIASTSSTTGTVVVTGGVGSSGNIYSAGNVRVSGASSVIGYDTGSGGAVTQLTSRTTGVTLNKGSGAITLFTAAGSTTATTFTVTNSTVAATDCIYVNQKSGTNLYNTIVTAVGAGSFNITFWTTGGTASDAPVFNFVVIKAVAA